MPAQITLGAKKITFWITYTRGGDGGYPVAAAMFSNGTEEAPGPLVEGTFELDATGTLSRRKVHGDEYIFDPPAGAGAVAYPPISFDVPEGSTKVWLRMAEVGATGTPGTVVVGITSGGYR